MSVQQEQERTKAIVEKVREGDCYAFGELEVLAKPLMVHLADYYSSLHYKFEYDDFYSICMNALYEACLEYNPSNPSFLSYAKTFMVNQCKSELEYWNASMRNPFTKKEVHVGLERDIYTSENKLLCFITVEDEVLRKEIKRNIEEIISSVFNETKADIMRLYINKDMRPRDIAIVKGLEYQNTYSVITRGMKKIAIEYNKRYSLDIINSL